MNKPVKALYFAITLSIFLGTSVVVLAAEEINENIDTAQEVEIATSQQNTSKNQRTIIK